MEEPHGFEICLPRGVRIVNCEIRVWNGMTVRHLVNRAHPRAEPYRIKHAASHDEDFLNAFTSRRRSPLRFFLLVFALSIPFWLLGTFVGYQMLPGVPVSALMFVCPVTAILILVFASYEEFGILPVEIISTSTRGPSLHYVRLAETTDNRASFQLSYRPIFRHPCFVVNGPALVLSRRF
jgi:hypothetical protein